MTTFGIRINGTFVPVASKGINGYKILNQLIMLVPKETKIENDNMSMEIKCVGDLKNALLKQNHNGHMDILREDVLTNELE